MTSEIALTSTDAEMAIGSTPVLDNGSMRNKEWRFNPPLHNVSLPVRVDFGSNTAVDVITPDYLPDPMAGYWSEEEAVFATSDYYRTLRLGRIIQHESASGLAAVNPYKYGFRFLYNPTSITIATSRNDSAINDPMSAVDAVISGVNQNFQTISFQLFLNRIPDVMMNGIDSDHYPLPLSEEDREGLRTYGTHWDMEYLYRVCNGILHLDDRGKTSDIGMLVASNSRLIIGPGRNFYGFVASVSYKDRLFSPRMVPILTEVSIEFRRHVQISANDRDGDYAKSLGLTSASGQKVQPTTVPQGGGIQTQDPTEFIKNLPELLTSSLFGAGFLSNISTIVNGISAGIETGSTAGDGGTTPVTGSVGANIGNPAKAPLPGRGVTTNYGVSGPWAAGYHTGADYGAPTGTPIYCCRDGQVVYVGGGGSPGWGSSYGTHVIVESTEGTTKVRHAYCHMSEARVSKGTMVAAGSLLGLVGYSGNVIPKGPQGSHLHYEERTGPNFRYQYDSRSPRFNSKTGK